MKAAGAIVINRSRFYFRERTSCARVFQKTNRLRIPKQAVAIWQSYIAKYP